MWWQTSVSEFVTLFLVINPFAALPVFLNLTQSLKPQTRRKLALSAVVIAFLVLAFFVFAGATLLSHMSISIRGFQISGGILLFLIALDVVRGQSLASPQAKKSDTVALAVYPLAIPMIAGPGAMLAVVLLTDDDRFNLQGQLMTLGRVALVLAITLFFLLTAGWISRVIGSAGVNVITRVMGMLLAALAVTLVLSAVGEWLNLPKL